MPSNLPPGVTESMIPGNRPEDQAWERVHEDIDNDAAKHGLSDMEVAHAWKSGLAAYLALKRMGVKMPWEHP